MSRSVVTAEKITPPKELEVLFDDPPLVFGFRWRPDVDLIVDVGGFSVDGD